MHLNAHLALGTAVTLVIITFLPLRLSFLETVAAIVSGVAVDGDFVFIRFARHKNHRMLPTHSMLLPFALCLASAIFMVFNLHASLVWMIWTCAVNVLVHQAVDSIDWGLNFFANGKIVGKKILLGGKTSEEFYTDASQTRPPFAAFYKAYYGSRVMRALEVIAAASMGLALAISWDGAGHEHWWTILAYMGLLAFHAYEYRRASRPIRVSQP